MLNRESSRADDAVKQLKEMNIDAELIPCDLSSFKSVQESITLVLKNSSSTGIDVLCCNADGLTR